MPAAARSQAVPYPPRGYSWYVVVLLTLAYIISFVDRQILGLLAELIKRDLAISDVQMSWLMGLSFAIFYATLGIPIGWLADRRSRRTIIAVGITIWCAMTAACGLAKGYWQLFLARVGVGVGEATLTPAALSMITDYFPRSQVGRAIGFYTMGISLGMGLAYIVGGKVIGFVSSAPNLVLPLVGELRAWQTSFLAVGLPGLLIAALMFTVREPARRGRIETGGDGISIPDAARFLVDRWRVYGSLIVGKTVLTITGYSQFWIPALFARTWGWSIPDVGLYFGLVVLIGGPLGTNLGGWFGDYLFARGYRDAMVRALLLCIAVTVPCFVLAPLMPTAPLALLVFFPGMVASAAASSTGNAALMIVTPNEVRAQISAVSLLVISIVGLVIGPTSVAMFTDYVFRDESALRYSMAIVPSGFGVISFFVLLWGRRYYEAAVDPDAD